MEWRCEWCGKPHEEDDPPCDNCGHGTFEKAVVQQAPQAEGPNETTLWVCTECGRAHPKHSPPCSRCGNATLKRETRAVDDEELAVPSYFDLLTPRYVLGLLLALGLAAVFVLGVTGAVDIPGFSTGVPSVDGVPGNATYAGGISLAETEDAYLRELNDRRQEAGLATVSTDSHLDEVARYVNQKLVKSEYADGEMPGGERLGNLIGESCQGEPDLKVVVLAAENGTNAVDTPDALTTAPFENGTVSGTAMGEYSQGITGVDLHSVDDGTVYLLQLSC